MTKLGDKLPWPMSRGRLEAIIVERAINDARFWDALRADPTRALRDDLGFPIPLSMTVRLAIEDPSRFYVVIPAIGVPETIVVPPRMTTRTNFRERLTALLLDDPAFRASFEQDPPRAIERAFNRRWPAEVVIHVRTESKDEAWLVMPYQPHDAIFAFPYALAFDPAVSTSGVVVPPSSSLRFREELSVEAWIQRDAYQDVATGLVGQVGAWQLSAIAGSASFAVQVGGSMRTIVTAEVLRVGQWHYLAGVFGAGMIRLFIDGIPRAEEAASGTIDGAGEIVLGRASGIAAATPFAGQIADVRLWGEALDESRIRANRPHKQPPAPVAALALRAYYDMRAGTGDRLEDSTDNHNDGRLHDTRWVSVGAPSV